MLKKCLVVLVMFGLIAGTVTGAIYDPEPGTNREHNVNAPQSKQGWWQKYDRIVHIISDPQPNPDPNDSGGRYDSYENVGEKLELLDEHIQFIPDYIVMPGDVTDYIWSEDNEEIDRAFETMNRLSWFYEGSSRKAMYLAGNHEAGGFDRYFRTFSDSEPKHLQTLSFGNFVFYGLNMRDGTEDYTEAVHQLESELHRMKDAGEKRNVFLFFHHTFPGTVSNCHNRKTWDDKSKSALNDVLDKYGGKYVVGAFSGDIHGSMFDPQTVLESTHKGVKFINAGVFSSGLVTDDSGNCEDEDSGIYESQFMGIKQGARTVHLYRHQTFYDQNKDGKNDVSPRWRDDYNSKITLAYPAKVGN